MHFFACCVTWTKLDKGLPCVSASHPFQSRYFGQHSPNLPSNPVRYSPLLFSAFATKVICSNIGVDGRKMMVTPPVGQGRVWCIFSFLRYRLLTLSCHPIMACAVWSGRIDLADLLCCPKPLFRDKLWLESIFRFSHYTCAFSLPSSGRHRYHLHYPATAQSRRGPWYQSD